MYFLIVFLIPTIRKKRFSMDEASLDLVQSRIFIVDIAVVDFSRGTISNLDELSIFYAPSKWVMGI